MSNDDPPTRQPAPAPAVAEPGERRARGQHAHGGDDRSPGSGVAQPVSRADDVEPAPTSSQVIGGAALDGEVDRRSPLPTIWPRIAEPGNALAQRHGAYSPRRVDPLAERLVERLLGEPDTAYLSADSYRPALWAWARAEARVQLLDEHVGDLGVEGLGADSRTDAAWAALDKAERAAERARARLGLDPLSRARLGRDRAATQVDIVTALTAAAESAAAPAAIHSHHPAHERPATTSTAPAPGITDNP